MAVFEAISTTYMEEPASSLDITSIPATYEHLRLVASIKRGDPYGHIDGQNIRIGTGGSVDTGTNYRVQTMYMQTGSENAYADSSSTNGLWCGKTPGYTSNSQVPLYGTLIIDFLDYTNTNKFQTVLTKNQTQTSDSAYGIVWNGCGVWENTATLDVIRLYVSTYGLMRGTTATLYGIKSS